MAGEILFNPQGGLMAFMQWLAIESNYWFFFLALVSVAIVTAIPSLKTWGVDWTLLGVSTGVLIMSIPLYFGELITEQSLFFYIVVFAFSLIKFSVFKE